MSTKSILSVVFCVFLLRANAQDNTISNNQRFSVLFGLNQPIVLRGFNAEVNYYTEKLVFDYSHGVSLHVDATLLSREYENQHVNFKITHSLGFGIGYHFTKALNVRFEPKMHIYETYYEGDQQTRSNSIANFTTYTLGIGVYYRYLPFAKRSNALKGITIVPSIRYWYKVGSTLKDDRLVYSNSRTARTETLNAPNIGFSNTPLFVNISLGYSF